MNELEDQLIIEQPWDGENIQICAYDTTTFLHKIHDNAALSSFLNQGIHMLNPVFFLDVMISLKNRFSEKGTYHLE